MARPLNAHNQPGLPVPCQRGRRGGHDDYLDQMDKRAFEWGSGGVPSRPVIREAFATAVEEYLSATGDPGFVHRGIAATSLREEHLIAHVLHRLPPRGTLIDIGAGFGIFPRMVRILRPEARVIVVDSERSAGTGDVDKLKGTGIETILAIVGETAVPHPDGVADVCFAGDVIEHLPHSPRPFVLELRRLLRPGGWLLLDTPNAVCLRTRLKVLLGVSNWTHLDGIYDSDFNINHHKEYTEKELRSLLERASFEAPRVTSYEHFWYKSLKSLGRLQTMGAPASEVSSFGSGFNPRHPYEYGRIACLAAATCVPSFRSSIVGEGRKAG